MEEVDTVLPTKKQVSGEQIAHRAYELWEARGRPPGDGAEDWLAAECELRGDTRHARIGAFKDFFARWFGGIRRKAA